MLLHVKPPLPNKMQKNNVFFTVRWGYADEISMFKNHFNLMRYYSDFV